MSKFYKKCIYLLSAWFYFIIFVTSAATSPKIEKKTIDIILSYQLLKKFPTVLIGVFLSENLKLSSVDTGNQ